MNFYSFLKHVFTIPKHYFYKKKIIQPVLFIPTFAPTKQDLELFICNTPSLTLVAGPPEKNVLPLRSSCQYRYVSFAL